MFIGAYNPACIITLSGATASLAAIVLASSGKIKLALAGLIIAGIADLFDGFIARKLKRSEYEKEYGIQIDTVVDVLAFVVTPAIIILNSTPQSIFNFLSLFIFTLAGVIRLAHFNTLTVQSLDQSTHHCGLPVTYTALTIPILYLVHDFFPSLPFSAILDVCLLMFGLFFVLDIPIRKPGGIFYAIFPLLASVLIGYLIYTSNG